jgi:hypothetical protein
MNNLIIKRSQLVEAQFTGTPAIGVKYAFTQVPNISRNNIIIYGFEVFTSSQLVNTPSNNPVIPSSAQTSIVITFVDDNNVERIFQIPYYTLLSSANGGFIRMVKPFILNLTKSYVQAVDVSNITEGDVASVNLYYSIVGE